MLSFCTNLHTQKNENLTCCFYSVGGTLKKVTCGIFKLQRCDATVAPIHRAAPTVKSFLISFILCSFFVGPNEPTQSTSVKRVCNNSGF